MPAPDDIEEALEQNALGPRSVTRDGMSIQQHSLKEQMDYQDYLERKSAEQSAKAKPHFGLRFTKLVPPGGG